MAAKRSAFDVLMQSSKKPRAPSSQNSDQSPAKKAHIPPTKAAANSSLIAAAESVAELKRKAANFSPSKAAFWGDGERIPFMFMSKALEAIETESSTIAITNIVCNLLRTVIDSSPADLLPAVYLLAGQIAPADAGIKLGIGDAAIIKALSEAYGSNESHIKKQYEKLGDLGLVAKSSRSSQTFIFKSPEPLTVHKVFDTFLLIANESGKDSQERKKNRIKLLLVAATDCEPLFLIRLLGAKKRVGLGDQTILTAIGYAAACSQNQFGKVEEAAKIVKHVYSIFPYFDRIIPALLDSGVWNLSKTCCFSPGIPIGPMLALPSKGVAQVLNKFHGTVFTCEYKYDGGRAQIHYMDNGSVDIYSRKLQRITGNYPDVIEVVSRVKKYSVTSFVLDCELVAFDREKKKILPFQALSTRARKDVNVSDIKVDVCIFAFDLLHVNGQSLMQEPLEKRREHLHNSFVQESGFFQFAKELTSNDVEEIQNFLESAVDSSCEGLIVKTLGKDSIYEPSKHSNKWLKLKKDYMDTIGDSLDLVPIAAFHGRGKRTGYYGAFLLACYDKENDEFQTICNIGTGFSEAVLKEQTLSLKVITEPKSYYNYSENLYPDVWFEPTEVWEVKAADLTISPVHRAAAGIVDPHKGISLRFPRLLRVRDDKKPEDATSSEMVAEMFRAQKPQLEEG